MSYTNFHIEKIQQLQSQIEARKPSKYAACTFRDSADLKQIVEILYSQERQTDTDRIVFAECLHYVANAYGDMYRVGNYLKLCRDLLQAESVLDLTLEKGHLSWLAEDFKRAVMFRNWFAPRLTPPKGFAERKLAKAVELPIDNCTDLKQLVAESLNEQTVNKLFEEGLLAARSRAIRSDPVEISDDFLSVVDSVEEILYSQGVSVGSPLYAAKMQKLLAERGIHWLTPQQLNPQFKLD